MLYFFPPYFQRLRLLFSVVETFVFASLAELIEGCEFSKGIVCIQDIAVAVTVTMDIPLFNVPIVDSSSADAIPNRYYSSIQLEICHFLECDASQVRLTTDDM